MIVRRIACALIVVSGLMFTTHSRSQEPSPEALGRVFLEAEAKNWIKAWIDAHPPNTSLTNLGGKTVFALELLMAADAYRRADTDKGRFHAAASGAAAFVAYSYAATPAVGLMVTAVYLCAQIIESAVAGSYAEAMLSIQKEMLKSEMLRQDLVFRIGMARAHRVLALASGLLALLDETVELDRRIALECKRTSDYAELALCMDLITRAMASRAITRDAIAHMMRLPDQDLDLLAAKHLDDGTVQQAAPGTQRAELQKALEEAEKSLSELRTVYGPMSEKFSALVARLVVEEAIEEVVPFATREQVYWACLTQHTRLVSLSSTFHLKLTTFARRLVDEKALDDARRNDLLALQRDVTALLQGYEQRRLTCPSIKEDAQLLAQFEELRSALSTVVR